MKLSYFYPGFFVIFLTGCEQVAVMTTAPKQKIESSSESAHKAERYFWSTLHRGNYQDIDHAVRLLMIAYLKNPNDPTLAAHLGFLHIWKITERNQRIKDPLIPDEIILAKKYFSDAVELDPDNAIYEGFLGDSQLVEGQIFQDKREQVHGYFTLKHAIAQWPQFNYFTAGYPMSTLSADTKQYKEALEWQWKTLDLCAGKKINRSNPDYSSVMKQETKSGKQRACWNSWKAPYNFEGFFMNMGDMLVKSGNWQTAVLIYKNAKLASNYSSWPYREMLEQRIINAKNNVHNFQHDTPNPAKAMMFNSGHGCTVCHRSS